MSTGLVATFDCFGVLNALNGVFDFIYEHHLRDCSRERISSRIFFAVSIDLLSDWDTKGISVRDVFVSLLEEDD